MDKTSNRFQNSTGAASMPAHGQATLSAIGDVSIAAADAVSSIPTAPRWTHWLAIPLFMILVYVATSFLTIYTLKSGPYVQAFCTPLLAVAIAGFVFWRCQVWKLRSKSWQAKVTADKNALNSLAHATANGMNAIRANVTALRETNSHLAGMEHLEQVDRALARIDQALEKSGK